VKLGYTNKLNWIELNFQNCPKRNIVLWRPHEPSSLWFRLARTPKIEIHAVFVDFLPRPTPPFREEAVGFRVSDSLWYYIWCHFALSFASTAWIHVGLPPFPRHRATSWSLFTASDSVAERVQELSLSTRGGVEQWSPNYGPPPHLAQPPEQYPWCILIFYILNFFLVWPRKS